MFESLKHWFESREPENTLFDHAEDEAIHVALAALLYHVIAFDKVESTKEKHEFHDILKTEFHLSDEQVVNLYQQVKSLESDLSTDLKTVNEYLKDTPSARMLFMKKLNHLISLDGVTPGEMEIFYEAQKVIFPEISVVDEF